MNNKLLDQNAQTFCRLRQKPSKCASIVRGSACVSYSANISTAEEENSTITTTLILQFGAREICDTRAPSLFSEIFLCLARYIQR